jgi:hypothetical protein
MSQVRVNGLDAALQTPDELDADRAGHDEAAVLRRRGLVWAVLAFAVCPCHLPLTLAAVGAVAGGTAVGDLLTGHPLAVGLVLGALTAGAYGQAWRLSRAAGRCSTGTCRTPRSSSPLSTSP